MHITYFYIPLKGEVGNRPCFKRQKNNLHLALQTIYLYHFSLHCKTIGAGVKQSQNYEKTPHTYCCDTIIK